MNSKRREFLKKLGLLGSSTIVPGALICGCRTHSTRLSDDDIHLSFDEPFSASKDLVISSPAGGLEPRNDFQSHIEKIELSNERLKRKSRNFNQDFDEDLFIRGKEYSILLSVINKINKLQKYVGHGHFNIVDWNDGVAFTKKAKGTGPGFTREEIKFLEQIFYRDASEYGFMGEKVFTEIDRGINRRNAVKIPYTGHYLVRGPSYELYQKIKQKVGTDLVLTSGARGTMKQFYLFLSKVIACKGNASKASRSIAPPGYSFHGRGDFDIGSRFLGEKNFTADFAKTKEYEKLVELGFVSIRYEQDNLQGVRFEPWHIKVDV